MSIDHGKTGYPAVYNDEHMVPTPTCQNRARRVVNTVAKTLGTLILMGCLFGLVYQVIVDQKNYDALLTKYNALQSEKMGASGLPVDALLRRDVPTASDSVSYVYSTTTMTQATTITIRKTASSTTSSATPTKCMGPMATVTVTVTECPVSSSTASSTTPPSPSNTSTSTLRLPDTVVVTHVTATTVYITDKGLVTPKVETITSTEMSVHTFLTTVNGTISTSTSTADAVSGALPSSYPTHFPNSTNPLEPYRTTAYGGVPLSTANFTVTLPPPTGTTTSKSDPLGTVVTVSGAHKNANAGTFVAVASILSMLFLF